MPSRRAVLAGLGTLTATAGCLTPRRSSTIATACAASIGGGGQTVFPLTPQVQSFSGGGIPVIELVVPIRRATVESTGVDLVEVVSGDDVEYRMPVNTDADTVGPTERYEFDDVVEYSQSLGHVPQTGRVELVARDESGEQIDSVTMDFRCYRQREEGP